MKLFISRNQYDEKGFFGKHKGVDFHLKARVELTDEESELVARYKADDEVLCSMKYASMGNQITTITIGSLIRGHGFHTKNIAELLGYEEDIKKACEAFKIYIGVMESFGGEEIIEF